MADRSDVVVDVDEGNERLLVIVREARADNDFGDEEFFRFLAEHTAQRARIGIVRTIWRWMGRIFRTGFSPRKEKEMAQEWDEANGLLVIALAAE